MGDDELKSQLQRSQSHSAKAHAQAVRSFDRRLDERDALTAASLREDQLFFDRKAKHRIGYEERSRDKLKNSPFTADLAAWDSKVLRQKRSEDRRHQLQREAAEMQRREESETKFRAKQEEKHREWELKKLQAEKREHLEREFVLKAQLDTAWSDRDLEHRSSPKRCLRDLQHTFFSGDAFVGPTRGSIRPSKGKFIGHGPQSTPPRLRTCATSLPELRVSRDSHSPPSSTGAATRSPNSKEATAMRERLRHMSRSADSGNAPVRAIWPPKKVLRSPSKPEAPKPPELTPDVKPPSPAGAGSRFAERCQSAPSQLERTQPGEVTSPCQSAPSQLERTQLPEQRSNVYGDGGPAATAASPPAEVAASADDEGFGTDSDEAREVVDSPAASSFGDASFARTCSVPEWDMEVTVESAAGHGLSVKNVAEGAPVTLGVDRGVFRLRRQGNLLTFESPLGGLYVGLDASGSPLLVRTGAEASAKRGVFREVAATNGEAFPWISLVDAGTPGRYLEADGLEGDPNNSTWKLAPIPP